MVAQKKLNFKADNIANILVANYTNIVKEFYEMQSSYLSLRYNFHNSLETTTIIQCFIKSLHLEIMRQRETNLDYNVSLNTFLKNLKEINIPSHKIVSVVSTTGIPKETVRRKIKNLLEQKVIFKNKKNEYYWNLTPEREKEFMSIMNIDINMMAKFICSFTKYLNLNLSTKEIGEEIKSQFSFYMYHFLNCQLNWLKMWQLKLKDVDLIFIAIQALIPTIDCLNCENVHSKNINLENFNKIIGSNKNTEMNNVAISASSISDVSGIPRATCIRKLEKLVNLGMLVREVKTKRYYVNQSVSDRTKNITKKENIIFTIESFSCFLSIVISALMRNKKY